MTQKIFLITKAFLETIEDMSSPSLSVWSQLSVCPGSNSRRKEALASLHNHGSWLLLFVPDASLRKSPSIFLKHCWAIPAQLWPKLEMWELKVVLPNSLPRNVFADSRDQFRKVLRTWHVSYFFVLPPFLLFCTYLWSPSSTDLRMDTICWRQKCAIGTHGFNEQTCFSSKILQTDEHKQRDLWPKDTLSPPLFKWSMISWWFAFLNRRRKGELLSNTYFMWNLSRLWWHKTETSQLERWRWENCKFEASLGNIVPPNYV